MRPARFLLVVAAVGLVLLPGSAWAGGRRDDHRGGGAGPRGGATTAWSGSATARQGPRTHVAPTVRGFVHVAPSHHFHLRSRPIFPFVVSATPAIVVSQPTVYVQPAPVVSVAPVPMPTLVEYPTGWYQLRGDGITTAYVWVWIPKPPAPPASEPPAAAPPAPPAEAPLDPPAEPQSSAPRGELYRWTDEQGGTHWTDRLDSVPEPHRAQARRGA